MGNLGENSYLSLDHYKLNGSYNVKDKTTTKQRTQRLIPGRRILLPKNFSERRGSFIYQIWCKTDYRTFFAVQSENTIYEVGLELDPRIDFSEIKCIGEQLLAKKLGLA